MLLEHKFDLFVCMYLYLLYMLILKNLRLSSANLEQVSVNVNPPVNISVH